jgi:multiple antibiotic resistance protein
MVNSFFFIAFTTLITIVNPIGAIAPFIAVTHGYTLRQQRRLAQKAVFVAGAALVACAAVGSVVFKFYGITLPAVKVAGGILVLLVSIDMLHAKESRTKGTQEETQEAADKESAGIFPLAIPLLTGPGSILSTFMLMDQADSIASQMSVYLSIVLVMATTFVVLTQAHHLTRLLGQTGLNVLSRLMGLVLASIAMQFILDGIKGALPGLG